MEKEEIKAIINQVKELPVIDPLKLLYMKIKDKAVTDSDMLQYDITPIYQQTKIYKVKNGEIFTAEIKGEVRTGKSTVAYNEIHDLNKLRYLLKRKPHNEPEINIKECIAADQTEFVRLIHRRPRQCSIMIDEYNAMAEGGANATTEAQQIESYNTMLASDYVDRINCNPVRAMDSNAILSLHILGKLTIDKYDKQGNLISSKPTGKTRVQIIYQDRLNQISQTLGFADINVWKHIENWEKNVRHIFEKENKTKEEKTYILQQAKKDNYVAYQVKKEKRQKLLTVNGIRDIRELEYSKVCIRAYKNLNKDRKIESRKSKIPSEIIIEETKDSCEDEGVIYSYYAESIVVNKIRSLLTLAFELGKAKRIIKKAKKYSEELEGALEDKKYAEKKLIEKLNREARKCALYDEFLKID